MQTAESKPQTWQSKMAFLSASVVLGVVTSVIMPKLINRSAAFLYRHQSESDNDEPIIVKKTSSEEKNIEQIGEEK